MKSYDMRQQLLKDRRHDHFLNLIEDMRKIEAGHCDSPSPNQSPGLGICLGLNVGD